MPRVRLDIADRTTNAEPGTGRGLTLDTDTLAAIGGGDPPTTRTDRPRIERWLACWSR